MEQNMQQQFIRSTAQKIKINQIKESKFVQDSNQEPNYLLTKNQEKIYRINVVGIVISKEQNGSITNFSIDDGTGNITARVFEENNFVNKFTIGSPVLVVGKVREFNEEKYISPEICKVVNPLWVKVRSLELISTIIKPNIIKPTVQTNQQENQAVVQKKEIKTKLNTNNKPTIIQHPQIEKKEKNIIEEDTQLPFEKIIQLIKELDSGEGVLIEDVLEKTQLKEPEKIIEKMLERGDIFKNMPGKIKVL